MAFATGVVLGIAITFFHEWAILKSEWRARKSIEGRLRYLEVKLCCGAGIFGCTGGPNCKWDHK